MNKKIQTKFAYCRKIMGDSLIERNDEIDLLLCAVICKEHVFLCGEPGTAKSLIATTVTRFIKGARDLTIHCCKDTSRNAAFGPMDLFALKNGEYKRVLDGGAADVHILIMEEVFKAGPAVLDMFLMLMNERVLREGLVQVDSPLRTILGVGNEWTPEGHEAGLSAFFDRFLFRGEVKKVSLEGRQELLYRAETNDDCVAIFKDHVTLTELDTAYEDAMNLPISDGARSTLMNILSELDNAGVTYGDRRLKKAYKAARAHSYLNGREEVKSEDLDILSYVLWNDPGEQRTKCQQIVNKLANPLKTKINELRVQARDIVNRGVNLNEMVDALETIERELRTLGKSEAGDELLEYVIDEIKQTRLRKIGKGGK